jgi:hypothetical protein
MKQGLTPTKVRLHNWMGHEELAMSKLPFKTRKDIVQECKDMIEREGIKLMLESKDTRGVQWEIEEVKTVPIDVNPLLIKTDKKQKELPTLIRHLETERVKYSKTPKGKTRGNRILREHLDWFGMWCTGASQQAVADSFKNAKNQVFVGRVILRIRESILGYAVENWIAEKYPAMIHGGGNTPKPDFETDTQVISVKARCRHNPQWSINSFGIEERKRALETGKELQLWYFELKYEPRLMILRAEPVKEEINDGEEEKTIS